MTVMHSNKTPYCVVRTDLTPELVLWFTNSTAGAMCKMVCCQHDDGSVELEITLDSGDKQTFQLAGPTIVQ